MKALIAIVTTSIFLLSARFALGCEEPSQVSIPNGDVASVTEITRGSDAIKRLMSETQKYLQCIEIEDDSIRTSTANLATDYIVARENQMSERHNNAVTKMVSAMQSFNEAVARFQARQK